MTEGDEGDEEEVMCRWKRNYEQNVKGQEKSNYFWKKYWHLEFFAYNNNR